MSIIIRSFRQWWQPPRDIRHRQQHRQVSFLELFYDLVYVAVIAELTHTVSEQVDGVRLGNFAFLFVIVWWGWINGTLYHELHGNDDIRTRLFTFLQMITVVGMASFAHDALGETSAAFAWSCAIFQLILCYMWWRTGVYDPSHAPLSRLYTVAYLSAGGLFMGSTFIETPARFYLWGIATGLTVFMPVISFVVWRNNPDVQEQMELSSTSTPSLVERFGLFTIIVMGEVIVGVVSGLSSHHEITGEVLVIGLLSMLTAISLWWLYFDLISHQPPHKGRFWTLTWIFMHLPTTAAIALAGAAIVNVIEHGGEHLSDGVRWLMVGSVALAMIGIAILAYLLQERPEVERIRRSGRITLTVSAFLIAALGLTSLETIPLMVAIVTLMFTPIVIALLIWIKGLDLAQSPGS